MTTQRTEDSAPIADRSSDNRSSLDSANTAIRIAIEQKGLDVRGLDMRSVTDIADYFVLISGTSERHVQGMIDKLKLGLRELGEEPNSLSGYDRGEWILLDYGDVVIHAFYEPIRQYYLFDELWKKADELPLDPKLEEQARKLRTGLYR